MTSSRRARRAWLGLGVALVLTAAMCFHIADQYLEALEGDE